MTRGKKARALRVDRTAEREAHRRKERQQTLFTGIVIAIVVGIGGYLVYISALEGSDVAESPSDLPTPSDGPTASEPPDERPVACGGQLPANADQPKEGFPEAPADSLEKGKDYQATITTSCGKISVDLLEKDAPKTVSNFVFLAEQGFWDGLEIFRNAASIGALQTGAGNNSASYDHGYTIPDELKAAERLGYKPGTLAMANTGQPNSGSSQFFFVYNDKFTLDPTYAVFGVADEAGAKVLEEIGGIPTAAPDDPSNELPSERVFMESVKITAK